MVHLFLVEIAGKTCRSIEYQDHRKMLLKRTIIRYAVGIVPIRHVTDFGHFADAENVGQPARCRDMIPVFQKKGVACARTSLNIQESLFIITCSIIAP